nr:hypothetical protein [Citrobacter sp. FP75]
MRVREIAYSGWDRENCTSQEAAALGKEVLELRELNSEHTDFIMPSRISNIEHRTPLEIEGMYRAMMRQMFARAGLRLHDRQEPEEDSTLPPPDEFTCSECGCVTDDPEGRHYCREDNSND